MAMNFLNASTITSYDPKKPLSQKIRSYTYKLRYIRSMHGKRFELTLHFLSRATMTATTTHNIDISYLHKWKENQFHLMAFLRLTQRA